MVQIDRNGHERTNVARGIITVGTRIRNERATVNAQVQGGPKKVSHYQESSLNRIKNRQCGYISRQF